MKQVLMRQQAKDTLYPSARPRQAKWAESEVLGNGTIRLTHQTRQHMLDLDQSSQLIWGLCDGQRTVEQLPMDWPLAAGPYGVHPLSL